jgi:NAD(P)H-hydrate epimerase
MEEAGRKMAELLLRSRHLNPELLAQGALVVAGPGHNGGDARVIARVLGERGVPVSVLAPSEFASASVDAGFVVDGIFGVGLAREVTGEYRAVVEWINAFSGPVFAVDIPSGLNAGTGAVMGVAVRATETLTVFPPKVGCYLRKGPEHCGRIRLVKIDFPPEAVAEVARDYFLMEARHARAWLPRRSASANKTKFGRAYIVAGAPGKWGAAVLSLRAAFRAGAGYVVHSFAAGSGGAQKEPATKRSCDVTNPLAEMLSEIPEAMSVSLARLPAEVASQKLSAVGLGPGAGFSAEILRTMKSLASGSVPVVLDADALTVLSKNFFKLPRNWIVTPHAGELSRLIGWSTERIEGDPLAAAKACWQKLGCTVVLKGLYTAVVSGDSGRVVIVPRGNVALAKAGTGDVLTGLITGFLAQGLHPVKAALLAVYVHGFAAELWVRKSSVASFTASDLIAILPQAMKALEDT